MKYRSKMILLSYVSIMSILILVGFIFGYYIKQAVNDHVIKNNDINIIDKFISSNLVDDNKINTTRTLSIQNNDNIETSLISIISDYETTMRSCLGSYCFDDAVQSNDNNIIRIGILMPDMIYNKELLKNVLAATGLIENKQLEIIYGSNVPPYGYGKNHGW